MSTQSVADTMTNMRPDEQLEFASHRLPELEKLHYMRIRLSAGLNIGRQIKEIKRQIEPKQNFYKNILLKAKLQALNDMKFKDDMAKDREKTAREVAIFKGVTFGLIVFLLWIVVQVE